MWKQTPEPYVDPEIYDALFANLLHDLSFYAGLAREAGGPVLDLCCGTGRLLLRMLERGVDVEGVDLYAPMLEQLRKKASAAGLDARVSAQDMRTFSLPRRFRLIVMTFNAFAHALNTEDQLATLRRCAEHLESGGVLAFDTMHGATDLLSKLQEERVLELETKHPESGAVLRLFDTREKDWLSQRQHSIVEVEEVGASGRATVTRFFETHVRWTFRSEIDLLLAAAGFSRHDVFGGFDRGPLTAASGSMVVVAVK